jgi:hypothetical protein
METFLLHLARIKDLSVGPNGRSAWVEPEPREERTSPGDRRYEQQWLVASG